jgi:hypothetical protein
MARELVFAEAVPDADSLDAGGDVRTAKVNDLTFTISNLWPEYDGPGYNHGGGGNDAEYHFLPPSVHWFTSAALRSISLA